jgi:ribosomal protein S27AE
MGDFLTLTCPSCGARLHLTDDIERFACQNCGNEHLVRRSGGIVALTPLVESLEGIGRAADRHASELAVGRLRTGIAEDVNSLAKLKGPSDDGGCLAILICLVGGPLLCRTLASMWIDIPIVVLMATLVPALICVAGLVIWAREQNLEQKRYLKSKQDLGRRIDQAKAELEWHERNLRRASP